MDYSKRMTGFTKLFSSIVDSTVWREALHVKVVWITMLAKADRNGRVPCSLPGLADAARVSLEQCQDALAILAAPDPYSRTKAHEGRRVEECDGGWQLLNYLKYRALRDAEERRIQTREAVARHRQKATKQAKVSHVSRNKPNAEAEAEAEADPSIPSTPPAFEVAWSCYPKRPNNSKATAKRAWDARMADGVDPAVLVDGVRRYAAYIEATDTAPQFVKLASTFLGPDEHYLSDFTLPESVDPYEAARRRLQAEEDARHAD